MFDYTYVPATNIHLFFEEYSEGLQNAALLLGGQPSVRRVQRLINDLHDQPQMTRGMRREVIEVHQLLTLEHVHDDERAEAAYFALLDPSMPYVEDICALADGLTDAMEGSLHSATANQAHTSLPVVVKGDRS